MVAFVLFVAVAQVFLAVDISLPPAEDAAMLMRYAQHLADGHGIVLGGRDWLHLGKGKQARPRGGGGRREVVGKGGRILKFENKNNYLYILQQDRTKKEL